jgi:hypothetical protein
MLSGNPRGKKLTKEQQQLVVDHMFIVKDFICKKGFYKNKQNAKICTEDLEQVGYYGLCIAALKFDPAQGVKFKTYATQWVKANVLEEATNTEVVNIPKDLRLIINKFNTFKKFHPDYTTGGILKRLCITSPLARYFIQNVEQHGVSKLYAYWDTPEDDPYFGELQAEDYRVLKDLINEIWVNWTLDNDKTELDISACQKAKIMKHSDIIEAILKNDDVSDFTLLDNEILSIFEKIAKKNGMVYERVEI